MNSQSPWFTPPEHAYTIPTAPMNENNYTHTTPTYYEPPSSNLSGSEDTENYDNEPPLLEGIRSSFSSSLFVAHLTFFLRIRNSFRSNLVEDTVCYIADEADQWAYLRWRWSCGSISILLLVRNVSAFGTWLHKISMKINHWAYVSQSAKIHFGYIYGFGVLSCLFMYLLMNLLSSERTIDIYRVCSVLGYCLLPIIGLAAINVLISIKDLGLFGFGVASICALWSTHTASRFFEKALYMSEQKYLVAYPIMLVYSCFVLITVFWELRTGHNERNKTSLAFQ